MKKTLFVVLLLCAIAYAQYTSRYLHTAKYAIAAAGDSVITFTNSWNNATVFTLDDSVRMKFFDADTTDSTMLWIPIIANGVYSFGEKTPLKKIRIHNMGSDTITVYLVGDKTIARN